MAKRLARSSILQAVKVLWVSYPGMLRLVCVAVSLLRMEERSHFTLLSTTTAYQTV